MKRILIISIVGILVLVSILLIGCAKSEAESYHIDREITGQVVSIDNRGDFSVLSFGNGVACGVTNSSLNHWRIDNMFVNVWTYKLQKVETHDVDHKGFRLYNLIDVSTNPTIE